MTIALSVTIRPNGLSNVSDAQINRGGWATLGPNLGVFPLEQTHNIWVCRERTTRLTNGEIISDVF